MSKTAKARLLKEFRKISTNPPPNIEAAPLPSNILEWHYVVTGLDGSPYEGGVYHGKLVFPPEYPFKPPSVFMLTPNGRFKTNTRLCLSMSDFHPETWNPLWSVSSILTGLVSFMLEDTPTYGSITSTPEARRRFAEQSLRLSCRNPTFVELFPHWKERLDEQPTRPRASPSPTTTSPAPAPAAPTPPPTPNTDKLIIALIVATLAFAISLLYT